MSSRPSTTRSPLPIVLFTIFIDLLGIGILIPVIPQLLANPQSSEYLLPAGVSVQQGYILLGLLTAIYPLMMFLAAPILGQISDHKGRRPILAISLTGTAVSYALFAVAISMRNIPLLFVSRALDGITGGNISVAQAAVADSSTPENRSKAFGLIGAAFGLGFIVGPFLGGKLADPNVLPFFTAATPFWFAAILSLLNTLSVIFLMPETNNHRVTGSYTWSKSVRDIVRAFTLPNLRWMFLVGFLFNSGFTFFTTFFGVFLIQRFGYTQGNIGDFFAYLGICIAVTQGFLVRRVSSYLTEIQILRFSFIATGIGIGLYMLPTQSFWLYIIAPLFAIVQGLTMANFMGLLSRSASADMQGEILGINASVSALAQSIPPILSGFIAAGTAATVPSFIASGIIVLAGIIFISTHRHKAMV